MTVRDPTSATASVALGNAITIVPVEPRMFTAVLTLPGVPDTSRAPDEVTMAWVWVAVEPAVVPNPNTLTPVLPDALAVVITWSEPPELTRAPTPLEPVTMACTSPDDAETTVGVPLICTSPEDADTMTSVPVVPTVNVPPDVATTTSGAELSVTVPELRLVADERVTVPDVMVVAVLTTVQLDEGETMPDVRDPT